MASLFEVKVSAPGKVILHGEHSVLYQQYAVAGSLGLRTTIVLKEVEPSNKLTATIDLPSVNLKTTLSLDEIKNHLFVSETDEPLWKKPHNIDHEKHLDKINVYLETICRDFENLNSIQKNSLRGFLYILSGIFGDTTLLDNSLDLSIDSGLSVGAGTGSSASFAVCLSAALIQLLKLKSGIRDEEFSDEDKLLISAWAFNCEKIMHGTPSGIDNSTCTFGSLVGFRKGEQPQLPTFQTNLRILLVDTRVSRQTKVLVEKVASVWERNRLAAACIMDACGHIATSAMKIMEDLSAKSSDNSEAQYQHLAELWNMNHCLLASLGVSHPSLEDVRASAARYGLACKLTGAGGGGYAIVLIPPSTEQATVEDVIKELEGKGYLVKDTQLGGPGVRIEPLAHE